MQIFNLLLLKIIPFYALIACGYIAGKKLNAKRETISSILIYIIAPVVIFSGLLAKPLEQRDFLIPLIMFIISSTISLTIFFVTKSKWQDSTPNILAFASGAGNTGYFGLPIALLLFGNEAFIPAIMAIMSTVLFESTIGFYITARGKFAASMSFKKLLKLPTIYAFIAGSIININGFMPSQSFFEFTALFKGAYSILGMMIIGLALSTISKEHFDFKFITTALFSRFVIWPLTMGVFIALEKNYFHIFNHTTHKVLLLMSCIPIAANTVVFATELKVLPEKAASAVFISSIVALFFIPLIAAILS